MPKRSREGALTEVLQALGRRLRELRLTSGFTQEKAAQAVGVSAQALRNWEAGRHEPHSERLKRLATLYGITLEELMGHTGMASPWAEVPPNGVPIRGYLVAGPAKQQNSVEIGTDPLLEVDSSEPSRAFALVVSGDSLAAHGIQNGDLILVDPDGELEAASMHAPADDLVLSGSVKSANGLDKPLNGKRLASESTTASEEFLGRVVWHLRRI